MARNGGLGTCAYCGKRRKITRDHVIPKSLFDRPLPKYMPTVPSCNECNNDKSKHDSFLRDILVMDYAACESPIAKKIFDEKVMRAMSRGQSLAAKIMVESGKPIDIKTPSGLIVDTAYMGKFSFARAVSMFGYTVRGLNYRLRKTVLSKDCEIRVLRTAANDIAYCHGIFDSIGAPPPIGIGQGVFSMRCAFCDGHPDISLWLLTFYERAVFHVATAQKGYKWPVSVPRRPLRIR